MTENPQEVITTTVDAIAKQTKTSKAAISRFCQRLGYSGYSEMKYDMSRYLVRQNAHAARHENDPFEDPVKSITDLYADYVRRMGEACDYATVRAIASEFLKARKIKIFGLNRSFNSAKQMEQRLARMGFDTSAVSDTQFMNDCIGFLDNRDLVIIFTTRDNTNFYGPVVKTLHELGCRIVCITMSSGLKFAKYCDQLAVLPRISKDSNLSFLDDQPLFMIYVEILLTAIAYQDNYH